MNRHRVAIIGSGNIGIDLTERILRDPSFEIVALIGRRHDSPGLNRFKDVINVFTKGKESLEEIIESVDGVFDATSAFDHADHFNICKKKNKWIIDLTPSNLGKLSSPVLDGRHGYFSLDKSNLNFSMVTCGGQSSAGLLFSIISGAKNIKEVEISSSIAAISAGLATRRNIDQYIQTTESFIKLVSGCPKVKSILVLNPAQPPVMMRTTVTVSAHDFDLKLINNTLEKIEIEMRSYVPGYSVVVKPIVQENYVTASVRVEGSGYYLPSFSGNLDIINAAAVETAKRIMV